MTRENKIFDKYVTIPFQADFKILLALIAVRRQATLAGLIREIVVDWLNVNEPDWERKLSEIETRSSNIQPHSNPRIRQ